MISPFALRMFTVYSLEEECDLPATILYLEHVTVTRTESPSI